MTGEDNMNELNQLMMAERSVFADTGGGGELAQELGRNCFAFMELDAAAIPELKRRV